MIKWILWKIEIFNFFCCQEKSTLFWKKVDFCYKNIFFQKFWFFPSEARPKAELRSPEAELFSSLGNWVGNRKKVDKKKRYHDGDDHVFCTPPICLANFKKSVSFWRKSQDFVRQLLFFEKEKNFRILLFFIKNVILAWISVHK